MKRECTVAQAFLYGAAGGLAVVFSTAALLAFAAECVKRSIHRRYP